ncbi:MAG: SDR family oxidoreductase [Rhodococcus fascians]
MPSSVLVLGGTGMLGTAVTGVLRDGGIDATVTARDPAELPADLRHRAVRFDAVGGDLPTLVAGLGDGDYVVNCIGIIKTYIHDHVADERQRAIEVNADFPHRLGRLAREQGFRVIQIATDCVYSGADGGYPESAAHDALDVYGKSKSLGEVPGENFLNLRCSIIGPELKGRTSLLEWVLGHEDGTSFSGYTDHIWNGVTAQAFGRIAAGIIRSGSTLSGTHHVVPSSVLDKATLCRVIVEAYGRDLEVVPVATGAPIDRSISTLSPQINARLWADAGYDGIPSVEQMVHDLVRTPEIGETT